MRARYSAATKPCGDFVLVVSCGIATTKNLSSSKIIFLIGHLCKRVVCKTVDRTPPTENKLLLLTYSSYYGSCVFLKLSQSLEKLLLRM